MPDRCGIIPECSRFLEFLRHLPATFRSACTQHRKTRLRRAVMMLSVKICTSAGSVGVGAPGFNRGFESEFQNPEAQVGDGLIESPHFVLKLHRPSNFRGAETGKLLLPSIVRHVADLHLPGGFCNCRSNCRLLPVATQLRFAFRESRFLHPDQPSNEDRILADLLTAELDPCPGTCAKSTGRSWTPDRILDKRPDRNHSMDDSAGTSYPRPVNV